MTIMAIIVCICQGKKRGMVAKQKSTEQGKCEVVREIKARSWNDEVRTYVPCIYGAFISAVFLDS